MIKSYIITILVALCACTGLQAQLFGPQNVVYENMDTILYGVQSGDLDTDGDPDIIFFTTENVFWIENIDGNGTFANEHILDSNGVQTFAQSLVDLDDDGNLDILVSYFEDDRVVWYKNLGNGTFTGLLLIAGNLNDAGGVVTGDIDDDGDLDVVLGVSNGNGLYWKEHLDGNGTFGPIQTIDAGISQARTQRLGDIDGDGDLDIVTNGLGTERMSWFENTDGLGNFSVQHGIETSGLYENFFQIADLDGDNDLDLVSSKDKSVIWRENTDGLGTFGTPNVLFTDTITPPGIGGFVSIHLVDLDNDGDIDITYDSGFEYGKVYHINTDGTGTFAAPEFIDPPVGGTTAYNVPVDMDSDGDIDLLNNCLFPDTDLRNQYWYENTTILGTQGFSVNHVKITPNPAGTLVAVSSDEPIKEVGFYQMFGVLVKTVAKGFHAIDVTNLASGVYLLKIKTDTGTSVKKMIKK
ncbi:T9SS type A sorting domain-containing protein [Rasiella rasia]|uniref:T9SS type A sorting domain-containing protein n=1 Tax=Rasiella rasia TaxID=2744027 RepID=A0A6G6GI88_9FLAO|nr:T9SS type A sorting domain-containing protein [Rasiella rasia]QIE58133.1 T9SS type A sorting domain-containing protein [Rasiella rasia]